MASYNKFRKAQGPTLHSVHVLSRGRGKAHQGTFVFYWYSRDKTTVAPGGQQCAGTIRGWHRPGGAADYCKKHPR